MKLLTELFLDLLFPPKCMLCGALLQNQEHTLCSKCICSDLPELTEKAPEVPFYKDCVAPFHYETPIRDAILRLKFHGMQSYAEQFAAWMSVLVKEKLAGKYDVISWVPCSRIRKWTRGFDQAYLLARALAKELGMEPVGVLKKIRNNRKQSHISNPAARRANVLGVYKVIDPEFVRGKRILLIDDVLTTGATLSECGKMLQMAGSGELVCAVIASAHSRKE